MLGVVLRFTWLGHLNFRNDESFTLLDARQSWWAVFGFDGFYDYHPPLSFALAKIADLVMPEVLAARAVAALCAVLTIPVFYALAARLLDTRAALVASLLLATSPAHIEFSRIGRMYTPVALAITCSYWALVAYHQEGRRRWAAAYCLALALAVYLDYSALYALAPQVVPIAWSIWIRGRDAIWLLAAGVGAIILYGPWLTQIGPTIDQANDFSARQSYLEPSWERVEEAIPWIAGITGGGARANADWPNLWFRWPEWHELMILALLPLIAAGLYAMRRLPMALMVSLCLLVGTPIVAAIASQISPGFALRTILPAALGWCLLAGAAFSRVPMPSPMRAMAILSCIFVLVASANALPATYSDRGRTLRVETAAETVADVAPMGKPIITFSAGGMDTDVIDAFVGDRLAGARIITFFDGTVEGRLGMMPWVDSRPSRRDLRDGGLAEILPPGDPGNDALWFFTHRGPRNFYEAFTELGYVRLLHLDYARVTFDLWAKPGADLGDPVEINGSFAGDGDQITAWSVPAGIPVEFERAPGNLIIPAGHGSVAVTQRLDGVSAGLYAFDVDVLGGSGDAARATIQCLDGSGEILAENSHPEKEPPVEDIEQNTLRPAVLCPEETTTVVLILTSSGETEVTFRNARLTFWAMGDG